MQKYEVFLKKIYYLIHDEELESQDGKDATLANAIHAFKCLWNLKYAKDEDEQKFASYLQRLRDWRNDEAHNAPNSTGEEVNTAIKVVVVMYLYVTVYSINI